MAMALGFFQKGGDGFKKLEWPSSLDSAVLGAEKKLTAEGINKLTESNCTWALVPVCDSACVTEAQGDQRGGATPAERDARICRLEEELHKLKSHVSETIEVRQKLTTVKSADNCASEASMVVEQLEN